MVRKDVQELKLGSSAEVFLVFKTLFLLVKLTNMTDGQFSAHEWGGRVEGGAG